MYIQLMWIPQMEIYSFNCALILLFFPPIDFRGLADAVTDSLSPVSLAQWSMLAENHGINVLYFS
jgi:hypothetical protein